MNGGYAPITGASLFGADAGAPASYGVAVPANVVPMPGAVAVDGAEPGSGAELLLPREFFRSSGFGLLLLIALVVYFDVRVLNR